MAPGTSKPRDRAAEAARLISPALSDAERGALRLRQMEAGIRTLLGEEATAQDDAPTAEIIPLTLREPCPDCGGVMRIRSTASPDRTFKSIKHAQIQSGRSLRRC